jgi:hypothetical protein
VICPEVGLASGIGKITRLAPYIDYLDAPNQELEGFWASVADARPLLTIDDIPEGRPYLVEWNAFRKHPELLADVQPPLDFTDDWTTLLPSRVRFWLEQRRAPLLRRLAGRRDRSLRSTSTSATRRPS